MILSNPAFTTINDFLMDTGRRSHIVNLPVNQFWNYVEPDISVICDPRKLDDKGCNGAPDWVLEIVSPSSRRTDYHAKLLGAAKCPSPLMSEGEGS